MNILYVCFGGAFTPGLQYKENCMARTQQADGNQVTIVTGTETWKDGVVTHTVPGETVLDNGVRIVRFSLRMPFFTGVNEKIRYVKGLLPWIVEQKPDIIVFHILQQYTVSQLKLLKAQLPDCKIYGDCSTGFDNSARNFFSYHVLHRMIYRRWLKKSLPYWNKIFYVIEDSRIFLQKMYGIPSDILEFQPLGGILPTEEEYQAHRATRRTELEIKQDELLLVHAGKLEPQKKTDTLLRAFAAVPELKARLAVIGSIPEEHKAELLAQMDADPRVTYLGWKSGDDLQEYLCAADLYCQPGKVSAIMQNAVCCRCPVMLYPHSGYMKDYDYGNILWEKDEADMSRIFRQLAAGEIDLAALSRGSVRCAAELLDYRALAARLYR